MLPRSDHHGNLLCRRPSVQGIPPLCQIQYHLTCCGMVLFFVLIVASSAWGKDNDPSESKNRGQTTVFLEQKKQWSVPYFPFYQKYISPVDGQRCAMYPSCSHYLSDSISKHGILAGWVMGMDRLVRCGRDEAKWSSPVWVKGKKRIFDPVANNDFFWSDK